MATQMSRFTDLPQRVRALLEPQGDEVAHNFRARWLRGNFEQPQNIMDYDEIVDMFATTQFDGENHRRLAPSLAALYRGNQLNGLYKGSDKFPDEGRYDLIVIGTGPHGSAVASYVREKMPQATIIMIDKASRPGGQFLAYGDKPVFQMNSRVRKANRLLPPIPRTPASINPVGMYAPLELSDIAMGGYAWNTEIGKVAQINSYLAANQILLDTTATAIELDGSLRQVSFTNSEYPNGSTIRGKVVIDATGIMPRSTLRKDVGGMSGFDLAYQTGRIFDTVSLFSHFGDKQNVKPLERFAGKKVIVVGAGDSALTAMEALIGNLPAETYGAGGVSRWQPREIEWIGAPSTMQAAIEKCLRTRYKNGIVQNLPKNTGENTLIKPRRIRGSSFRATTDGVELRIGDSGQTTEGDILIDCTNSTRTIAAERREFRSDWQPSFKVGPYVNFSPFNDEINNAIENLGIPENQAALWATMPATDYDSRSSTRHLETYEGF